MIIEYNAHCVSKSEIVPRAKRRVITGSWGDVTLQRLLGRLCCKEWFAEELEQALTATGAGLQWMMSPCPPRSLATPPASGRAPFQSETETRVCKRANLCTSFFPLCAQLPAHGKRYVVPHGRNTSGLLLRSPVILPAGHSFYCLQKAE